MDSSRTPEIQPPEMAVDVTNELKDLRCRVDRFEEAQKERELSFLRALKTLFTDWRAYEKGEKAFPQAAILGAIFSYLRPRIVLVVGSAVAAIVASAQLWLLFNQNRLLSRQNDLVNAQSTLLRAQTSATELSAVSNLMFSLVAKDSVQAAIAVSQLAAMGLPAYPALVRLVRSNSAAAPSAVAALLGQGQLHTPTQVQELLWFLARRIDAVNMQKWSIPASVANEGNLDEALLLAVRDNIGEYLSSLVLRVRADTQYRSELRPQIDATLSYFVASFLIWERVIHTPRVVSREFTSPSWLTGAFHACHPEYAIRSDSLRDAGRQSVAQGVLSYLRLEREWRLPLIRELDTWQVEVNASRRQQGPPSLISERYQQAQNRLFVFVRRSCPL